MICKFFKFSYIMLLALSHSPLRANENFLGLELGLGQGPASHSVMNGATNNSAISFGHSLWHFKSGTGGAQIKLLHHQQNSGNQSTAKTLFQIDNQSILLGAFYKSKNEDIFDLFHWDISFSSGPTSSKMIRYETDPQSSVKTDITKIKGYRNEIQLGLAHHWSKSFVLRPFASLAFQSHDFSSSKYSAASESLSEPQGLSLTSREIKEDTVTEMENTSSWMKMIGLAIELQF